MVSCRTDMDRLIIWKSRRCNIEQDIDSVDSGEIMLILNSRLPTKADREDKYNRIPDEWKIGSYQVLTPRGKVGWIGAGWVTALTVN